MVAEGYGEAVGRRIERILFGAGSAGLVVFALVAQDWLIAVMAGLFLVASVRDLFDSSGKDPEDPV
jgi:hypothetical protein